MKEGRTNYFCSTFSVSWGPEGGSSTVIHPYIFYLYLVLSLRTRPEEPWKESPQDFGVRLRSIAQDINNNCNVEGLCRQLPQRLVDLADRAGDRLGT